MCEPMTIIAGIGLAMGAYGAMEQAEGQKNQAEYSAAVGRNNAQIAEWSAADAEARGEFAAKDAEKRGKLTADDAQQRGELEAQRLRRAGDMTKGSQRAAIAARGLDLGEGTAFDLQEQTDFFSLYDQSTARNNAAREGWTATTNAKSEAFQQRTGAARDAWGMRTQGTNYSSASKAQQAIGGAISPGGAAATSLISGAGAVASKWNAYSNTGSGGGGSSGFQGYGDRY